MAAAVSSQPTEASQKYTSIQLSDVFPTPSPQLERQRFETSSRALSCGRDASASLRPTDENVPPKSNTYRASASPTVSSLTAAWEHQQSSKKRPPYYEGVFAYREPHNTARDRVARDSLIMAEIKLNCKLEAEQSFLSDISFQLSEIYQRPESSITVSLCTPQAMYLGGSSDPAYLMTITALASQIAPTKNRRSIALVQDFMQESLDITPRRGVVRFEPTTEENLATNGMTALQEIEEIERHSGEGNRALESMGRNRSRRSQKAFISPFKDRCRTSILQGSKNGNSGSGEERDMKLSEISESETKVMKRRKSIMAFFGRYP